MASRSNCKHPALFNSMCVVCGANIKPGSVRPIDSSANSHNSNGAAANNRNHRRPSSHRSALNLSGGSVLQLSEEEAASIQSSKISGLRTMKKLALVLDLDHTLVHAVQVMGPAPASAMSAHRTVSSHVGDANINEHDVFHLPIEEIGPDGKVRHLMLKKRPHLDQFLSEAARFCQLSIYTAGTRRYAEAVANILDPTRRKYFAGRIVSRSDGLNHGGRPANVRNDGNDKSLERIFLGDSSMAVIIDDREDVWRGKQSEQLLLVRPFVHFDPTAGNSSFAAPKATVPPGADSSVVTGVDSGDNSVLPPTVAAQASTVQQPQAVISLCASPAGPAGTILGVAPLFSAQYSAHDDQLLRCLEVLKLIHSNFYGSDLPNSGMKPESSMQSSTSVSGILHTIKSNVLRGCTVTFSGIIPTNEPRPESHVLWKLAESLGAQVSQDLVPRTTHLICPHTSTQKVKEVMENRSHKVWVLHPDWLIYCRWSLSKVLEATFMLNGVAAGQPLPQPDLNFDPITPTSSHYRKSQNELQQKALQSEGKELNDGLQQNNVSAANGKRKIDQTNISNESENKGSTGMLAALKRLKFNPSHKNNDTGKDSGTSSSDATSNLLRQASAMNWLQGQKKNATDTSEPKNAGLIQHTTNEIVPIELSLEINKDDYFQDEDKIAVVSASLASPSRVVLVDADEQVDRDDGVPQATAVDKVDSCSENSIVSILLEPEHAGEDQIASAASDDDDDLDGQEFDEDRTDGMRSDYDKSTYGALLEEDTIATIAGKISNAGNSEMYSDNEDDDSSDFGTMMSKQKAKDSIRGSSSSNAAADSVQIVYNNLREIEGLTSDRRPRCYSDLEESPNASQVSSPFSPHSNIVRNVSDLDSSSNSATNEINGGMQMQ